MQTDTQKAPPEFSDDDDVEIEFIDGDLTDDDKAARAPAKPDDDELPEVEAKKSDEKPTADDPAALRAELDRERSLRTRAEQERDNIDSQSRARLAASEVRAAEAQRSSAKGMLETVDVKIRAAREAVKLAKREGNTDLEVEASEKLEELRTIKGRIEREVLPAIPSDEEITNKAREGARQPQRTGPAPRNDMARQWADANPWMRGDAEKSAAVQYLSAQIHQEGIEPGDPNHFAELTKRLSAVFPKMGVKGIGATTVQPRSVAPPVAGAKTSASRTSSPNRIKLGPKDAEVMRKYKLDPKDAKAQKYYARALMEIQQEESARK